MLVKKINVKDIVSNREGAVYDSYPNQNKYKAPVNPKLRAVNHTDKVKIDPDNQLSKEDRAATTATKVILTTALTSLPGQLPTRGSTPRT